MSFVDLATLTMHRRNELEARLNIFWGKCDRAVDDIKKLKMKTQGFVLQLNCDPSELKERFLSSMKQLDEYMYLITDFNIAISKLDEAANVEYMPVQDSFSKPLMPLAPLGPFNLIDALSEPAPSTSTACQNHCPPEKPKRVKTPKADQSLIVFSSTSSSEETVPQAKTVMTKEVQCELEMEMDKVKIEDPPASPPETGNLPAQPVLETDHVYEATSCTYTDCTQLTTPADPPASPPETGNLPAQPVLETDHVYEATSCTYTDCTQLTTPADPPASPPETGNLPAQPVLETDHVYEATSCTYTDCTQLTTPADPPASPPETGNLPAQPVLETDHVYEATSCTYTDCTQLTTPADPPASPPETGNLPAQPVLETDHVYEATSCTYTDCTQLTTPADPPASPPETGNLPAQPVLETDHVYEATSCTYTDCTQLTTPADPPASPPETGNLPAQPVLETDHVYEATSCTYTDCTQLTTPADPPASPPETGNLPAQPVLETDHVYEATSCTYTDCTQLTTPADPPASPPETGNLPAQPVLETDHVYEATSCTYTDCTQLTTPADPPASPPETGNLPAQPVLETDHVYEATIMHVDGAFFWVITDDPEEVQNLMMEMTHFYTENQTIINKDDVRSLTCCAFYDEDSDCFYRGLFLKLSEEDSEIAEIFVVDTGEMRCAPVVCVQPLYPRFCAKPPYARCCHLAGVDLVSYNKNLMEKQEEFMRGYVGKQCSIEVDDNTSESLGVFVVLPSGETLNQIIVQQGLALPIDKPVEVQKQPPEEVPSSGAEEYEISDSPEYEDPVEAVTGYRNRDEIDICKHYKGGPEKTCFKGSRCNKRHVLMHPDGWTLDRVPVIGKCKSVPLPAPDTWHKVLVTCVCHYDRVYVQLLTEKRQEPELPSFGVVLPATTLSALVRDMNSPGTRTAYKPLTITPAQGELVAALYPPDNNWYRARVLSVTRADQSVEVMYVDYGTILWVKEDQLRMLEPRMATLPMQAIRCVLAGVRARSRLSQQWAQAKRALTEMVQDKTLDAHVIARDYDEVAVELFDEEGYSIAEQLAANDLVELTEYSIVDDAAVTKKIVVP